MTENVREVKQKASSDLILPRVLGLFLKKVSKNKILGIPLVKVLATAASENPASLNNISLSSWASV
jgi:hypothetical protein